MSQMFSLKLFLTLFILLIVGAGGVGGYYLYNNNLKSSIDTPTVTQPVTSTPVSITLEISSPDEDTLSFDPSIIISGKTIPNSSVLISSKSNDVAIISKSDGAFSTLLDLDEGVNNIQISVFDQNGEQKDISRTVYYSKEKVQ